MTEITINNIDNIAPTIEITGTPTNWQNTNVTLTCNITDDNTGVAIKKYALEQKDISYFNGGTIGNDLEAGGKITVTNNTWITVYVRDNVGNEIIEQIEITKIDKVAPAITLSHNPTTQTNANVTITATTDGTGSNIAQTKWATGNQNIEYFTSNGTIFTDTFVINDNGTYTVYAKDEAGNEAVETYTISNIDTALPIITEVTITSNNANPEYAKVGDTITLTFTTDKKIYSPEVEIAGYNVGVDVLSDLANNTWTATYTMVDTDLEGTVAFKISNYQDEASNIGIDVEGTTDGSKVTFIKELPEIDVIYSTKEPTKQAVEVTLLIPTGITILNNEGRNTLTFTSNGTYIFEYIDVAGNVGTLAVEVTNIVGATIEENNNQDNTVKDESKILGRTIPKLGEGVIIYVAGIAGLIVLVIIILVIRNKNMYNHWFL